MLFREFQELWQPGHGAVVIDDFRQHPGGMQAGETREVNGGLGVARPAQHAASAIAQRKNVAGTHQIGGPGPGIGQQPDGAGTVGGGNAGGHVARGIHGNGVGRAHPLHVLLRHEREFEPIKRNAFHRHANDARSVTHHET